MKFKKYKKTIFPIVWLLALITLTIFSPFLSSSKNESDHLTLLLPDWGLMFQILAPFCLIILAAIIGSLLLGYVLAPLFLFVYKKTIGVKMIFGLQERKIPEQFRNGFRTFFPALMVINFAVIFSGFQGIQQICVNPLLPELERYRFMTFFILLPLLTGIVMGLFSAVWFLLDAGIVFTNKERVKKKIDPVEVRSVGGWYLYILKGYAGIGVIYAFIVFTFDTIVQFGSSDSVIPIIILIPILPFIIVMLSLPSMVLLDITLNHRRNYMLKFAKMIGISQPLMDPLNIKIEEI